MTDPFADMEPHDEDAFVLNMLDANERMGAEIVRLRARLAAVLALCDDPVVVVDRIRAAATGDTE